MDFYDVLELIKRRLGMYVGALKLTSFGEYKGAADLLGYLENFITGYYFGIRETEHKYRELYPVPFYTLFQSYCEIKYQTSSSISYGTMILEECQNDEEKALHRFFEVLDEFKEKVRIIGCEVCNLDEENIAFHHRENSVIKTGHYQGGKWSYQPCYQGVERLYHIAFSYGAHMLIPQSENEDVHGFIFRQEESHGGLDMYEALNPHMKRCFGEVLWQKKEVSDEQLFYLLDDYIFHGRKTKGI